MPVSWAEVSADFEYDGSLRDIYVVGSDLADWQAVIDAIRRLESPPIFRVGGDVAPLPERMDEIFATEPHRVLTFRIGKTDINCHFFCVDEIEFDLDPDQVDGPDALEELATFMHDLGGLTGKEVVLTCENGREAVILRCMPGGPVESVPPRAGRP